MKFESLTLPPFCLEKTSVRKMAVFSVGYWLESVKKYARITIRHVCFIALTLAGSLRRCLNTRSHSLVFKQLPREPANVNACKYRVIPIFLVSLKLVQ